MKKSLLKTHAALFASIVFMASGFQSTQLFAHENSAKPELPPGFPGGMPGEFGTTPDEKSPELTASKELKNGETISDQILFSEKEDESVLLVKNNTGAKAVRSTFEKTGGNTSNGGQSNFYGLNAAVVAQSGAVLSLNNVTVKSDADGANAVFSTGTGTTVNAKNIVIQTKQNSSRGLDATYGGTIIANGVDITTEGEHCAAFATDRGEGTVTVTGGKALTCGEGSPVIYSTGNISVKKLSGKAKNSEIAVIEGKNSISIENSSLTGGNKTSAVMLYQSMSGDANIGTSSFSAKNSTLTSTSSGPFFYITNTNAKIYLESNTLNRSEKTLIRASGNNSERGWGKRGANGGTLEFTASRQNLSGNIECDAISSVSIELKNASVFTGAINSENTGTVNLSLDKKSRIELTGNSYVNVLKNADEKFLNIKSNGYTLYYNKNASENKWLNGAVITLSDGGKIVSAASSDRKKDRDTSVKMPAPEKFSGTVKLYGEDNSSVGFVTTDGKEYTLVVFNAVPRGDFGKQGDKPEGKPEGKPAGKPAGKPDKMPHGGAPEAPAASVTIEDIKALSGKTVEITGLKMEKREENAEKPQLPQPPEAQEKSSDSEDKKLSPLPENGFNPKNILKDGILIVLRAVTE